MPFYVTNFPDSEGMNITISGKILSTTGKPIENACVTLDANFIEFPRMTKTDKNGNYSFYNNPPNIDYKLSASSNLNYQGGVSTLDYVQIIRHMLGIQELDTPYKIIAADINADNQITGVDLIHLRRLVLGITSKFPMNQSIRFLHADYVFPDPKNPWPDEDNYPYLIQFNSAEDITFDFIGVKIGDVTDNWIN